VQRAEALLDREHVGQCLTGVRGLREPVDHGYGRRGGKALQRFVLVGAHDDRVGVAREERATSSGVSRLPSKKS